MGSRNGTTDVLLVGGGVASVRCARTLRREGFDGRIVLIGEEPVAPYNRPPLSKELLRDDLSDELVLAEPMRWYERRSVELLTGRRVVGLELGRRMADLDDGSTIGFDRCLLATGAELRTLRVPGAEHAVPLRTLDDARRIRAAAKAAPDGAPVVIIGGGFIGLEVASSLASLGLRPTVVELGDAAWSGALGHELSEWALEVLAEANVSVRLGAAATRIAPDAAWVGDERLDAAFVVAGIGVLPRDELASTAGLDVNDGILVDSAQRTVHPAIWAAGDVARRSGRRIEHWHAAREGGERAALSMLGAEVGPAPAPWVFTEVGGRAIDVIGAVEPWDEERWEQDGSVLAYLAGGRLVGLAVIDAAMAPERAREMVAAGRLQPDGRHRP